MLMSGFIRDSPGVVRSAFLPRHNNIFIGPAMSSLTGNKRPRADQKDTEGPKKKIRKKAVRKYAGV